jgi:SAM-dependent methyltransferase
VVADDEPVVEQIDFYRTSAAAFDEWLGTLIDPGNHEPVATTYRDARSRADALFASFAPLGDVLEIAAGSGRLAELYLRHASTLELLDASAESIRIAAERLRSTSAQVDFCVADIFEWAGSQTFDTIVFSAWLHHVPDSRFAAFWSKVQALLRPGGQVIFDFPDAALAPPGVRDMPPEPSDTYAIYVPRDGFSVRDHLGRRWRVIHNRWHRDVLDAELGDLGWQTEWLGPGLFADVVWARAARSRR